MTQEVLMLALDALDNLMYWDNGKPDYDDAREAITAIKEALREHAMREVQRLEQEPVKYSDYEPDGVHHNKPPQRKPLTDEQIEDAWRKVETGDFYDCVQPFARAIEAAHGIKENT